MNGPTEDRPDVRELSAWLERGASRIELRSRSNGVIASWDGPMTDATQLARAIVERARYYLQRTAELGMFPVARDAALRAEQLATRRMFIIMSFPQLTTMRLRIIDDDEPDPVEVLRRALGCFDAFANLDHPRCANVCWLIDRLVEFIGAGTERLERVADLLSPTSCRRPLLPACQAPCRTPSGDNQMTTKTTKSRRVNRSQQAAADARTLTRAEVAKALGCSLASVRRMEGTTLHPTEDAKGVHRFDPLEVIHLLRDRVAAAVDPSREGERDARVFDLLDAGKGVREIVTTLRLPIAVVLALSEQWKEAGRRDLVIPPACRAELERCLGSAKDAAEVTHLVRSLEAEQERLKAENEKMSNRIGGVIAILGKIAARNVDVEKALPDLRNELAAEQIEMLDRAIEYHRQRLSAEIRVSVEPHDEADRSPAGR